MANVVLVVVFMGVLLALTKPLGIYMTRLFNGERIFLHPVLRPVERGVYRLTGVDETKEMRWTTYAVAMLVFSLFGVLVTLSNNAMSFLYHAYQAEVYPTRIRAVAVGFVYSWSRLSTVFSAFVIAFILGRFGAPGVFTFIAGSMLVAALSILLLGPKVNDRSLEAISH